MSKSNWTGKLNLSFRRRQRQPEPQDELGAHLLLLGWTEPEEEHPQHCQEETRTRSDGFFWRGAGWWRGAHCHTDKWYAVEVGWQWEHSRNIIIDIWSCFSWKNVVSSEAGLLFHRPVVSDLVAGADISQVTPDVQFRKFLDDHHHLNPLDVQVCIVAQSGSRASICL